MLFDQSSCLFLMLYSLTKHCMIWTFCLTLLVSIVTFKVNHKVSTIVSSIYLDIYQVVANIGCYKWYETVNIWELLFFWFYFFKKAYNLRRSHIGWMVRNIHDAIYIQIKVKLETGTVRNQQELKFSVTKMYYYMIVHLYKPNTTVRWIHV